MTAIATVRAPMTSNRQRREARRRYKAELRARATPERAAATAMEEAEALVDEPTVCVLNEAPAARRWRAMLPLQQMEARGQISSRQLRAGLMLRGDWESAGFQPRVTVRWSEPSYGVGAPAALSVEERYSRFRWCVNRMALEPWALVQDVALLDRSVYAMTRNNWLRAAQMAAELRDALDMLARLLDEWWARHAE